MNVHDTRRVPKRHLSWQLGGVLGRSEALDVLFDLLLPFFLLRNQSLVESSRVCPTIPHHDSEQSEWDGHCKEKPRVVRVLHSDIARLRCILMHKLCRVKAL
jgi:hypothetical protein